MSTARIMIVDDGMNGVREIARKLAESGVEVVAPPHPSQESAYVFHRYDTPDVPAGALRDRPEARKGPHRNNYKQKRAAKRRR